MCRFIAYIGQESLLLAEALNNPVNSLINQSRRAREGSHEVNADGFGLAWYDFDFGQEPGIYKSTSPAWNNTNLLNLANKIKSKCFLAHVRASTVGGASKLNCHPFLQNNCLFVHNGTIHGFSAIKQELVAKLKPEIYLNIQGQTDSEHFFALMMNLLGQNQNFETIWTQAFIQALYEILELKKINNLTPLVILNSVITDGKHLLASCYSNAKTKAESEETVDLYYTSFHNTGDNILVASEPLNDLSDHWMKIPENHLLYTGAELKFKPRLIRIE